MFSSNQPSYNPIERAADPAKYNEIVQKLCAKRKTLEEVVLNHDIDIAAKDESALTLQELKAAMSTFGISEIDYQAYLAKNTG